MILHNFNQDINNIELPAKFTFPFNYKPHKLCTIAAAELQAYLAEQKEWQEELQRGKMFGILVVEVDESYCSCSSSSCNSKSSNSNSSSSNCSSSNSSSNSSNNNSNSSIFYLVAFSGTLAGKNTHPHFIPPVYDMLNPSGYFREHEGKISAINREIDEIEKSEEYLNAYKRLELAKVSAWEKIEETRRVMKEAKRERERVRGEIAGQVHNDVQEKIADQVRNDAQESNNNAQLIKESQFQKAEFKRLERKLKKEISELEEQLSVYTTKIEELKQRRKRDSAELQKWLFEQFKVLNANGKEVDLTTIFLNTPQKIPPAGAGECAAPKLLQYAYKNNLRPIAMAEFWWGDSPKREIRKHGLYYPACKGKCEPILKHMLQGLDVEQDPLLERVQSAFSASNTSSNINSNINSSTTNNTPLEIIYEDNYLLAVNKPSGMLSTPGKVSQISVYSIIKELYPEATGPLTVHRLDMNTSGILLIAKSKEVHEKLQAQFAQRQVKKRYIALLEGKIRSCKEDINSCKEDINSSKESEGIINLPLMADIMDRPKQCVDFEHGKRAITRYKVLEYIDIAEVADYAEVTSFTEVATKKDFSNKVYTRVALYPLTGRTHQLRVHCAHKGGLNTPIVGDELYGTAAERLYLHAEEIEFIHPITNTKVHISKSCDF